MKKFVQWCLPVILVLTSYTCFATWSIIIVDANTKMIGMAGASCTYSVYGIGGIVPGKGAVIVQAMSNKMARGRGMQMIMANATPKEILATLRNPDFEPEDQQYAIVTLKNFDQPASYTGGNNPQFKGALSRPGISVQGNILSNDGVLQAVMEAATAAQNKKLPIEEVLLVALEAGAKAGGDKRCGERRASSAFITVARPGDAANSPWLNLVVTDDDSGTNAVTALRKKFKQHNTGD